MKVCTKCGVKITSGKLCVSCRNCIKKGGVWHELLRMEKFVTTMKGVLFVMYAEWLLINL